MRIAKTDVPIKINAPGAVARQQVDFGDATNYGAMGGEHFSMAGGTDITPLLQGLDGDMCQAPHWGYLIEGELTVLYQDGGSERVAAGDLFFWPPGHSVKADRDAEFVLFSPQHEHTPVLDHINGKLNG
jgi:hypothetical protein